MTLAKEVDHLNESKTVKRLTERINWGQAAAEVILLILGVALALGVDALVDARAARNQEQAYLRALAADFGETAESVARTIQRTGEVRDTVLALLGAISDGSVLRMPPDELNDLVSGSFWYHSVQPNLSTYQDLLSSGDLDLIRSPELRIAMSAVVEALEQAEEHVAELAGRWATLEEPYLVAHFVIADAYQGYRGVEYPDLPFETEPAAIRSREFSNILAGRVILIQDVIRNSEEVLRRLSRVEELIDQAIPR